MSEYPAGDEFHARLVDAQPATAPWVPPVAACEPGDPVYDVGELLPDDHDAWSGVDDGSGAEPRA